MVVEVVALVLAKVGEAAHFIMFVALTLYIRDVGTKLWIEGVVEIVAEWPPGVFVGPEYYNQG